MSAQILFKSTRFRVVPHQVYEIFKKYIFFFKFRIIFHLTVAHRPFKYTQIFSKLNVVAIEVIPYYDRHYLI